MLATIDLNFYSVLAATVAGMMLGALWYSPVLFGNLWMQAIGKTKEDFDSQGLQILGSIFCCLLSALALGALLNMLDANTVGGGLFVGSLIAFGLVSTAMLSDNLFCEWGLQLFLIQAGYRSAYILIMCLIIAGWPQYGVGS